MASRSKIPKQFGPRTVLEVREVRRDIAPKLLKYPNVTGSGVGYKQVAGRRVGILCIRVYVRKKVAASTLKRGELIPKHINGIPTDVIEDRFRIHVDHTVRRNPILGGISVGNAGLGGSGTLGGCVFERGTRQDVLLSNWHVLCGRASCQRGEHLIQPGTGGGDTGTGEDIVGRLERWALTKDTDAAIGRVSGHRFLLRKLLELGTLRGIRTAELGLAVTKSGRTTGVTSGIIADIDGDVEVDYPDGSRQFEGQLIIENGDFISKPGDSGSIFVDNAGNAVGLLFAGSKSRTIANRMTEVAQALDLDFSFGLTTQDLIGLQMLQTF